MLPNGSKPVFEPLRGLGWMTDRIVANAPAAADARPVPAPRRSRLAERVLDRLAHSSTPFEMVFPDGSRRSFGTSAASFTVTLRDSQAMRAVASMDEGRVGDAYVEGHIDFEGDMLRPF